MGKREGSPSPNNTTEHFDTTWGTSAVIEFDNATITTILAVVIPFGFVTASLLVMWREKQYLWFLEPLDTVEPVSQPSADIENPYQPQSSDADTLPFSPMSQRYGRELTAMNYVYLGAYRHAKRGIYQIRYDAMLSSDKRTLALIEVGTVMSIPVQNLSLITLGRRANVGALMSCESITNDACFDALTLACVKTCYSTARMPTKPINCIECECSYSSPPSFPTTH